VAAQPTLWSWPPWGGAALNHSSGEHARASVSTERTPTLTRRNSVRANAIHQRLRRGRVRSRSATRRPGRRVVVIRPARTRQLRSDRFGVGALATAHGSAKRTGDPVPSVPRVIQRGGGTAHAAGPPAPPVAPPGVVSKIRRPAEETGHSYNGRPHIHCRTGAPTTDSRSQPAAGFPRASNANRSTASRSESPAIPASTITTPRS